MSELGARIAAALPEGMVLPELLERLLDWSEGHGWVTRLGEDWTAVTPYPPGQDASVTMASFEDYGDMDLALDLGLEEVPDEVLGERLYMFCRISGSGARAAWWLDDEGRQRVVSIEAFDGSRCLFDDTDDFLRALAMGYAEVNDTTAWDAPSAHHLNQPLRDFLTGDLGLDMPTTLAEIASQCHPDPFRDWLASHDQL